MNTYTTIIRAIDPHSGELTTYSGPYVPGITKKDAEMYCQRNGLGYCEVGDILVAEIDFDSGEQKDYLFWN